MARVLIAEDHPLFRAALRDIVRELFAERGWPFDCIEAEDRRRLDEISREPGEFDLVLLDLFMPGTEGLSGLVELRDRLPAAPIVVVSSLDDPETVRQAIACGAAGFVPKSSPRPLVAQALGLVLAGGIYLPRQYMADRRERRPPAAERLTARQRSVLALLAEGKSNKQIARDLAISDVTVKAHMTAIMQKLGVSSRLEAIVAFRRLPPASEE